MDLVLDGLSGEDADTRYRGHYAAIQVLKKAGWGGPRSCCGNPAPHGSLRGCSVSISSCKREEYGTRHWFGCEAAGAVGCCHLQQGDVPALRTLVTCGGWPGWMALHAVRSAKTAHDIKPLLPLLREMLECSDGPLSSALRDRR